VHIPGFRRPVFGVFTRNKKGGFRAFSSLVPWALLCALEDEEYLADIEVPIFSIFKFREVNTFFWISAVKCCYERK